MEVTGYVNHTNGYVPCPDVEGRHKINSMMTFSINKQVQVFMLKLSHFVYWVISPAAKIEQTSKEKSQNPKPIALYQKSSEEGISKAQHFLSPKPSSTYNNQQMHFQRGNIQTKFYRNLKDFPSIETVHAKEKGTVRHIGEQQGFKDGRSFLGHLKKACGEGAMWLWGDGSPDGCLSSSTEKQ